MTTATNTTPDQSHVDEAASAVAEFRSQNDQWAIADALVAAVPVGSANQAAVFGAIQAAVRNNRVKPLSASAMRQYRDTAARWDAKDRIDGINYTCHRQALGAKDPVDLISSVIRLKGDITKVTVASIRQAVDASNGVTPAKQVKQAAAQAQVVETIDWSSDAILKYALYAVSNMSERKVDAFIASLPTPLDAGNTTAAGLRRTADLFDKRLGKDRAPVKKVGTAKAAPKLKKAATPKSKTPAPKGGGRRGRVKGA